MDTALVHEAKLIEGKLKRGVININELQSFLQKLQGGKRATQKKRDRFGEQLANLDARRAKKPRFT